MDREVWQATVHSVAKSQTRLKQLSKHTCQLCYELVLETQKDSFLPFFLESFHVRETEDFCVPPCLAPSSASTEALLWRTLPDVALHLYPLISFHHKSVI